MGEAQTTSAGDLSRIVEGIKSIDLENVEKDKHVKEELLALSQKLTSQLEGPLNRALDLIWRPIISICVRIAVDLKLFEHICSASGPISSKELATLSGGEEVLIYRMLRLLADREIVEEHGENLWGANDTTRVLTSPPIAAGNRFSYDIIIASAIAAPKYFRETGYKVPIEPTDGIVQYANQTKLDVWDHMASTPSILQDFNHFMGNAMGTRAYWHEWFDVEGRIITGFDSSRGTPLLVDIGGGKGHDMNSFHKWYSEKSKNYQGGLVLQDLPQVIRAIPEGALESVITKMEHNMFDEQPVKGARAYLLNHILHDWSDKYCLQALKSIRKAMTPGYSKLIIGDVVMPNTGAKEFPSRMDIAMMVFNAGMERSKAQWRKLLTEAGFSNIEVFVHFDYGVVEAEVAA